MTFPGGVRGRYAPSPTGAIHLGNARTALLAWLDTRALGGAFVMRVEDLDRARVLPGAEAAVLEDLRWLGLDWDEGPDAASDAGPDAGPDEAAAGQGASGPFAPYRQSERTARYDAAVDALLASGAAFPCACSRADVARAASAPHPGDADADEDGPRYPGTCRDRLRAEVDARAAAQGRPPAVRFRGGGASVDFVDLLHGPVAGDPRGADDFVLRRSDGTAAYQLAVVVDDAAMAISRVVRADDLLTSTPRQLALYRALGVPATAVPAFAHVPLVLAPGGERLAKRRRPISIATLRARGVAPEAVVGVLAASAGLCPPGTRVAARDLVAGFHLAAIERGAPVIDGEALPFI